MGGLWTSIMHISENANLIKLTSIINSRPARLAFWGLNAAAHATSDREIVATIHLQLPLSRPSAYS